MIDIKNAIDDAILVESCSAKHVFESPDLTFADIRDVLTKVFSGEVSVEEQLDGLGLMITYKDGKFMVAKDDRSLKDPDDYDHVNASYAESPEEVRAAFENSMKDLSTALSELDDVQLNRFFANGRNFLSCRIVYPPCANIMDYGNRCFIALDAVKCYNDKFKEVGSDEDSAKELFTILRNNGALRQETFEITRPAVLKLKNLVTAKEALATVLDRLGKFIDGVGWKCSLDQYVCDRYSRHIVNKALEHGIDVSRNSDFVNTLARRLSQISGQKPTKADLATYAKCDGVDTRSDSYREFLADLEDHAEETNAEIIRPVEDLIIYAGMTLMKNVIGFMSADPSKTAKKFLADLEDSIQLMQSGKFELSPEQIARFKKNLAKIEAYHEGIPAEGVVVMYKGRPLKLTGNFGAANEIMNLVKYR